MVLVLGWYATRSLRLLFFSYSFVIIFSLKRCALLLPLSLNILLFYSPKQLCTVVVGCRKTIIVEIIFFKT